MALSRRRFVAGGLVGCGACCAAPSWPAVLSTTFKDTIGLDYEPLDDDERGLWHASDQLERGLVESDLVLKSADLNGYVVGVVERLLDHPADDLRIYVVRDARFNATMAPNGLMVVHTGFLARAQNEAQLASVLGHEAGHYFGRHTIERWRSVRRMSAAAAFAGAAANAAAGYTALQGHNGQSWIDIANAINYGLVLSMFSYSRGQESEADAYGIARLASGGYPTTAAAAVWRQLIEERQASAAARDKDYRDKALSVFSTHPPNAERMKDLADTAVALETDVVVGSQTDHGRERWVAAREPFFAALLEEQVKLNDPGASLYLLDMHAQDGWTGTLRYYEGETYRLRGADGDPKRAADAYAAAVTLDDAPAEAWRAHGYALIKQDRREDGRAALSRYLELKPQAADAAMVRYSLDQQGLPPP